MNSKIICTVLTGALTLTLFTGCGTEDGLDTMESNPQTETESETYDPEMAEIQNEMSSEYANEVAADSLHAEEEESESESDEIEYDEHVWLSVRNAKAICKNITETLCSIDSANAQFYRSNNEDYSKKLNVLDENYTDAVKTAARQVVLFGDRFPFRYLIDDYSITYYAAFAGCSAETEASFKTITFLVSKVDELNLPAVLVLENSNKKIADTIIQNTKKKNQEILVLDSMQSTTKKQIADGKNYLGIMADTLAALKKALN